MRTIKQKRKGRNVALYAVFVLLAVVLLFPYFFMINRGLMSNEFILQPNTRFFPDGLHFENYGLAFREGGYGKPLGSKSGTDLSGLLKIKLRDAGLRIVYKLVRTETSMLIIVIGARADDAVYKIAEKRAHKHEL